MVVLGSWHGRATIAASLMMSGCDPASQFLVDDPEVVSQITDILRVDAERADFAQFTQRQWKIVCAVGGAGDHARIDAAMRTTGIVIDPSRLRRLHIFKSSRQLVWLEPDGGLKYALIDALTERIQPGEMLWVTPNAPVMQFLGQVGTATKRH